LPAAAALDGAHVAFRRLDDPIDDGELSPGERALASSAKGEPRRREILSGRAAAHAALAAAGVYPLPEVLTSPERRPLLVPPCGFWLSLAHDGDLAVAACSRAAVGVDVVPFARRAQIGRTVRSALEARAATMDPMIRDPRFPPALLLWTGWEALGKQSGEGVFCGMEARLHSEPDENGAIAVVGERRLRWWRHGAHLVCLATVVPRDPTGKA